MALHPWSSILVKFPLDILLFFHKNYTPWILLWVRTAPCQRIVQDKWLKSNAVYWAKVNCFDFLHVRCQTTCEVFPVGLFYICCAVQICSVSLLSLEFLHNSFPIQLCIHCYLTNWINMWIVTSISDNQACNQACPHVVLGPNNCSYYWVWLENFFYHSTWNRISNSLKIVSEWIFLIKRHLCVPAVLFTVVLSRSSLWL